MWRAGSVLQQEKQGRPSDTEHPRRGARPLRHAELPPGGRTRGPEGMARPFAGRRRGGIEGRGGSVR